MAKLAGLREQHHAFWTDTLMAAIDQSGWSWSPFLRRPPSGGKQEVTQYEYHREPWERLRYGDKTAVVLGEELRTFLPGTIKHESVLAGLKRVFVIGGKRVLEGPITAPTADGIYKYGKPILVPTRVDVETVYTLSPRLARELNETPGDRRVDVIYHGIETRDVL